jgi:hypothetical protein
MTTNKLFLQELKDQYEKEFELKDALEGKANNILTISGLVATLLFGFGSFMIDKLGSSYEFLIPVTILLIMGIIGNVVFHLDPDTRYLLCTVLSQKKDDKGARRLFHELARVTKHHKYNETIKTITTDGLPSYKVPFEKEFVTHQRTNTKNPPKHLFNAGIAKEINNNMMERLNGTIRSREKNYRGLKIDDTPMIPLFVAYYNMIREHQALEKTPAEAAGLEKLGKDKWINLIKKAHKNPDGKIRVWEK